MLSIRTVLQEVLSNCQEEGLSTQCTSISFAQNGWEKENSAAILCVCVFVLFSKNSSF